MTVIDQGRPLLVLMCGSRDWQDPEPIRAEVNALPPNALVIEGGAPGADAHARHWAKQRGLHVATVNALWSHYGRRAGPERNLAMLALRPDRVVAFQRDGSRGTQHTIDEATRRGIPCRVHTA